VLPSWTLIINVSLTLQNQNCPIFAVRLWITTPPYRWPIGNFSSTCMFRTPPAPHKGRLHTAAINSWSVDSMECHGGMVLIGERRRNWKKEPVSGLLCPPRIPHRPTRSRTRASAVRLTAWASARPSHWHYVTSELVLENLNEMRKNIRPYPWNCW
jgi:hypothetical protein